MSSIPGEIKAVRQIRRELRRRWFTSNTMDLVVWCDASDIPVALQFCYDKGLTERALSWNREQGYSHRAVDDGESAAGLVKATPLLGANVALDILYVDQLFHQFSDHLPIDIRHFVSGKIKEYSYA